MRVITLDTNKKVTEVKYVGDNYVLQAGEIETDLGEMGQIKQEDGSFITPIPETATAEPTPEDKVNYLYYKSMEVIQ